MNDRKVFSVRVKKSLIKPLKFLSVELEVSMGELVEKAFNDLLKKHRISVPKEQKVQS
jgi:hypothetical protein